MSKNSAAWSRWSPLRRRKPCTSLRAEDRRGWRSLRFRQQRQRHFPCQRRSLRNRRTAPRLRKRRRSDYWKPSLYSSYVAYARCSNSRGRVWSRNSASCSLKLPREITDSSTVFRVLLDLDRCVLPVAYYIRELENFLNFWLYLMFLRFFLRLLRSRLHCLSNLSRR